MKPAVDEPDGRMGPQTKRGTVLPAIVLAGLLAGLTFGLAVHALPLTAAEPGQTITAQPPGDLIRKPDGPYPPGVCPDGYRYDPVTRQCVPVIASPTPWPCPPGYYWDQFLKRCVPDRPIPLPVPLTGPSDGTRPG